MPPELHARTASSPQDCRLLHRQIELVAIIAHQLPLLMSRMAIRAPHVPQVRLMGIRIQSLGAFCQRVITLMAGKTPFVLHLSSGLRHLGLMALLALHSHLRMTIRQEATVRRHRKRRRHPEHGHSRPYNPTLDHFLSPDSVMPSSHEPPCRGPRYVRTPSRRPTGSRRCSRGRIGRPLRCRPHRDLESSYLPRSALAPSY